MKVIAFVGMPGAGKSVASDVAREMGIPVIIMGDVLREAVKEKGLPLTDENIGGTANALRKEEGMDAIAKRCVPRIREAGSKVVVVDGVRGIAEAETFRKEFGEGFTLIRIEAPFEVRLERLQKRARSDATNTPEELKRRDERELSWGMGEAIEASDLSVTNLDPIERFKDEVRAALKKESILVTISALVFPTEIEDRVAEAVENIFPEVEMQMITQEGFVDRIEGTTSGLEPFHGILRRSKILDTARQAFYVGLNRDGKEISFELNKQAAYMGYVNFLDHEVALGGILVTISYYDIERLIDWLAPRTSEGRPIAEIEL
jgi:predicted RNA binding protein with dsRBD fold (UPF0201 family)/dephospho-CoA kinase